MGLFSLSLSLSLSSDLFVRFVFFFCYSFSKLREMKKNDRYNYCDIKMNVLIEHKSNFNGKKIAIVGEIQFLVKWMLRASLVKKKRKYF